MTLPKMSVVSSLACVRIRRPLLLTSLAIALVVSLGGGWLLSADSQDDYQLDSSVGSIALNKVSEGNSLTSVQLEDPSGNLIATDTWLGQPLVVNFWFSTCEPCRREFPVLVAADRQFDHVRFIGVNINDTSEAAARFLATYNATFDNFFDRDGRLTSALSIATAPVTLLIDAGGVVRRQLTGEITAAMLNEAINEVFPS
jgi:thiol-disulfide isomerase/thioredoxin